MWCDCYTAQKPCICGSYGTTAACCLLGCIGCYGFDLVLLVLILSWAVSAATPTANYMVLLLVIVGWAVLAVMPSAGWIAAGFVVCAPGSAVQGTTYTYT